MFEFSGDAPSGSDRPAERHWGSVALVQWTRWCQKLCQVRTNPGFGPARPAPQWSISLGLRSATDPTAFQRLGVSLKAFCCLGPIYCRRLRSLTLECVNVLVQRPLVPQLIRPDPNGR